jgi:phosphohistidine phosphatase SixA
VIHFKKSIFLFSILICVALQSCSYTIYISRHAEKEISGNTDPILTKEGKARAEKLSSYLKDKKVKLIFSTNTIRTKKTAEPTAQVLNATVSIYDAKKPDLLCFEIKELRKNTLIIGHSNTIKDIVNTLNGKPFLEKDLEDNEYDKLFIVKRSAIGKPRTKVYIY